MAFTLRDKLKTAPLLLVLAWAVLAPAAHARVNVPFDTVCYGGSEGDECGPENVSGPGKCVDEGDRLYCRFVVCDEDGEDCEAVKESPAAAPTDGVLTRDPVPPPTLSVNIPTVTFSELLWGDSSGNSKAVIPWIAEYISGAFRYAVGAAAVIAAVMFMVAGLQYTTAGGNAPAVDAAKSRMVNASAGLLLVVGAYLFLSLVNPELTRFKSLDIVTAKRIEYVYKESGDSEKPLSGQVGNFTPPDVHCPRSGGPNEIPKIIDSLKGKVAYRFGGKGGPPPYEEFTAAQMKASGKNFDFHRFNDSCPDGNLCLDCSGFVNFVLRCAGMGLHAGGTKVMLGGKEEVQEYDLGKKTVNGKPLQPGDLLGFTGSEGSTGIGHVYLYIGNGSVAESAGGVEGRQPGANPKIHILDDSLMKHVKRINRVN